MALTRSDLQNPAEVYVSAFPNVDAKRITDTNPQVRELALGKGEVVKWKSADGMEIEGVLIYPVGYEAGKQYPLLANIHGGPSGAWTQAFPGGASNAAHAYAGKGWFVFLPNVRGSSGYGEKFLLSNRKDWGGGDYRDIQTGLDDLVKRGLADPQRLGQTGWSYGGYMTAWTLTQTDRFKAVMVGAGLTNMFSMYSTNDLQRVLEGYFGDEPLERPGGIPEGVGDDVHQAGEDADSDFARRSGHAGAGRAGPGVVYGLEKEQCAGGDGAVPAGAARVAGAAPPVG